TRGPRRQLAPRRRAPAAAGPRPQEAGTTTETRAETKCRAVTVALGRATSTTKAGAEAPRLVPIRRRCFEAGRVVRACSLRRCGQFGSILTTLISCNAVAVACCRYHVI